MLYIKISVIAPNEIRGKFRDENAYIRKRERLKLKDTIIQLKNIGNEKQDNEGKGKNEGSNKSSRKTVEFESFLCAL